MNDLLKFFNARRNAYHTDPKLIDDVIYTPYVYDPPPSSSSNPHEPSTRQHLAPTGDLLGIPELREDVEEEEYTDTPSKKRSKGTSKFDTTATEAEIFLFDYGTVVIWGMSESQEKRFLSSLWVCRPSGLCSNSSFLFLNLTSFHFYFHRHRKRFEIDKLCE